MRTIFANILALLLATALHASVLEFIPCPKDQQNAKTAVWTDTKTKEEVLRDRESIQEIEAALRARSESVLRSCLGPGHEAVPGGFLLPVARHAAVGFSGLGYTGGGKSYFLEVGEIGGILIFPYGAGDLVSSVTIYLKEDKGSVILRSEHDYAARRAWEMKKLSQFRRAIGELLATRE